jgi:hypothetical protein
MEPDPREPTGDFGYDMAHEVTGGRPRPQQETPQTSSADDRDDAAGDHGYDEAHDFRG